MLNRQFTRTGKDGVILEQHMQDVSWDEVRNHRGQALAASDWRALKDVTLTTPWRDFRAALRNLPQDFPDSANDAADNFPEAPDE